MCALLRGCLIVHVCMCLCVIVFVCVFVCLCVCVLCLCVYECLFLALGVDCVLRAIVV